jgi:hypothetical protein
MKFERRLIFDKYLGTDIHQSKNKKQERFLSLSRILGNLGKTLLNQDYSIGVKIKLW